MRRWILSLLGLAGLTFLCACGTESRSAEDGVGVFVAGERAATVKLRSVDGRLATFGIAPSAGLPVAGDWDGDGRDTVGYFEPGGDVFHLSDDFGAGAPQFSRVLVGWECHACYPVAADFGGLGVDGIGVYDPSRGLFLLRDRAEPDAPIRTVVFGDAGTEQLPIAGRFAACPQSQVGLYEPATATFRLRGCFASEPTRTFRFGPVGGVPVVGRWQRGEFDGVGVFESAAGRFLLRSTANEGAPDLEIQFFHAPAMPIAGRWNFDSP